MTERLAYTVKEAATALGVSEWMVREEIRQQHIYSVKMGARLLIPAGLWKKDWEWPRRHRPLPQRRNQRHRRSWPIKQTHPDAALEIDWSRCRTFPPIADNDAPGLFQPPASVLLHGQRQS